MLHQVRLVTKNIIVKALSKVLRMKIGSAGVIMADSKTRSVLNMKTTFILPRNNPVSSAIVTYFEPQFRFSAYALLQKSSSQGA